VSGPPNDLAPSELYRKLSQRPRPSDVVDFPRKDGEGKPVARVRLQVLTLEQHDEARHAAQRYLVEGRGFKETELNTEIPQSVSGDAVAVELLALAIVSENPVPGTEENPVYRREFLNGTQLRRGLSADEIAALFKQYLLVQHRYGPTERTIESEDDLNSWIRILVAGGRDYPLALLDLPQLAELTSSLAGRVYSLSQSLESLSSNWSDTLKSDLAILGVGTGFFGALQSKPTPSDGESSVDDEPMPEGKLVDARAAESKARRLRGKK